MQHDDRAARAPVLDVEFGFVQSGNVIHAQLSCFGFKAQVLDAGTDLSVGRTQKKL